jgi:hypothetical protein
MLVAATAIGSNQQKEQAIQVEMGDDAPILGCGWQALER